MIYNGIDIGLGDINAYDKYFIEIYSKDKQKYLILGFNREEIDIKNMKLNEKMDLTKYLYWDNTLQTEEAKYVFDSSKEKKVLTKIGNNKYKLEVEVRNPDIIYTVPDGKKAFDSLIINCEISFVFDYKPPIDRSILDVKTEKSDRSLMEVLDKL